MVILLINQLTSHQKLRIIKTEWGAFGKRSAHRKIQEVSFKMGKWQRSLYQPVLPLGKDGKG